MADIVSRIYGGFRGVDFRGEEINLARSPDSLNIWKDYRETESIRTRPCMENTKFSENEHIYGIFFYKDYMIVHSGKNLRTWKGTEKTRIYTDMNEAPSRAFVYDDVFYIMDGKNYLRYDGTTQTAKVVDGYIPTTSIARKPKSGGTTYEDVNMLQSKRINTFLRDGEGTEFWLDTKNIDADFEPVVEIISTKTGQWVRVTGEYTVNYEAGKIIFKNAPVNDANSLLPPTDGEDDLRVTFRKTVANYRNSILNCTMHQVFDNRVFVSGNPDFPNMVWHCSLNDPTYFSDLDYYQEGMDSAKVTGMVAGNNALWVFREPSDANTNVFYHTPTIDEEYGKIYPSSHSSVTTGCIGKAINFNDDIVFFSERGMEGISGDITTEQVVAHRSSLVDRKLIAEADYKNMLLEEWEGYLLVIIGDKVYLADSKAIFSYENHMEYEWFYWQLEKPITCTHVHDGVLYLGTADGHIYTLTDMEGNVESWWTTPLDKFNNPHKLKTTNKRGCVAEATGDIAVYAKVEDTEFGLIGSYENVTDCFVSRIKCKNFKDIQLKFHSNTRFSLETVTMECFVGGYIKRAGAAVIPGGSESLPEWEGGKY